jgi:probable F420-dependent oxidoreductase
LAPPHPFRFAVQSFSAESASQWRERARRAEDLGYSALHLADHFLGPGPVLDATRHPLQELAAVPAMAVAAEATDKLRIGCRVFCVDYRHPVMLAKEAASLDFFSGGRLELGLGAGWLKGEYEAAGIDFDPASVRIERLAEAVQVLKALMAEGPVSFHGRQLQVQGFEGVPKPVQKPHPPLMIGGGGKRILSLAAREADVVSFNFDNRSGVLGSQAVKSATAAATAEKVAWVRECAGDRAERLEFEIGAYFTFVTDDAIGMATRMGAAFGLSGEDMLCHPHALIGTIDAICLELERRRELYGFSYVTVGDAAMEAFAPVVAKLG